MQSKLPDVGITIFTKMALLAKKHNAINLAQGFPEFGMPEFLQERLAAHTKLGHNQYAPSPGLPVLQEQIAALVKRCYGNTVNASESVTVTSGATEALFVAIQAFVKHGDEVIVFDPAYDSYAPAIKLAGGKSVHIALRSPDFKIDWDEVRSKVSKKTSVIMLNTPHNPCGSVIDENDLKELKDIVIKNNLILISDEVYEHIIFDNKTHLSINTDPELFARSVVLSSFGKTFHCTGWKMGYCVAPKELTDEFRKVHQFVTFSSFTPAQFALAEMLEEYPEHISALGSFYQNKRDFLVKALDATSFKTLPCYGSYFLNVDYSQLSDQNDIEFSEYLTEKIGVATIPISVFYAKPPEEKILRLCFAKNDDTMLLAAERLSQL